MLSWSVDEVKGLQCDNRSRLLFTGTETEVVVVYSSAPIAPERDRFYFEAQILGDSALVAIGLSTNKEARKVPGWCDDSIAIFGFDGAIHHGLNNIISVSTKPFKKGDTIGCYTRRISDAYGTVNVCQFEKNGEIVGPTRYLEGNILYPAVAMGSKSAEIITNLGSDKFRYSPGIMICLYICKSKMLK